MNSILPTGTKGRYRLRLQNVRKYARSGISQFFRHCVANETPRAQIAMHAISRRNLTWSAARGIERKKHDQETNGNKTHRICAPQFQAQPTIIQLCKGVPLPPIAILEMI
jgi:hypothetical protein